MPRQNDDGVSRRDRIRDERNELLNELVELTERPMIFLAFVWIALLVIDFTAGLNAPLRVVSDVIWVLFVLDFAVKFVIAPRKGEFLKQNWLTALALALPALRALRAVRALRALRATRALRSLRLIRLMTRLNRSMKALRTTLGRRGIGYVLSTTVLIIFVGAAGMQFFESPAAGGGLNGYSDALWWTAMIITTMGSDYWPKTAEGRVLGWLLSVYALSVFGYITATIASFFVGRDQQEAAGAEALRGEIADLRSRLEEVGKLLREREDAA